MSNLENMHQKALSLYEERKLEEFRQKNTKLGKAKHQQIFVFGVFRPMVYMLYIVSVLALFLLGAKGVLDGKEILGQTVTSGVIVSFYADGICFRYRSNLNIFARTTGNLRYEEVMLIARKYIALSVGQYSNNLTKLVPEGDCYRTFEAINQKVRTIV